MFHDIHLIKIVYKGFGETPYNAKAQFYQSGQTIEVKVACTKEADFSINDK
jgi:hypothetical protein